MLFKFQPLSEQDMKPRMGLQGPYRFNHAVVYWDPLLRQYWSPNTGQYLNDDETDRMISFQNGRLRVSRLL